MVSGGLKEVQTVVNLQGMTPQRGVGWDGAPRIGFGGLVQCGLNLELERRLSRECLQTWTG